MRNLRQDVLKGLDLPTSIGIAPSKTLAKVSNKIAKKFPEKQDLFICSTRGKKLKLL